MAVYVVDHFTDADNTDLAVHVPDTGVSWDDQGGGAEIVSNQLTATTFGSGVSYSDPQSASADTEQVFTVLSSGSAQGGMVAIARGDGSFSINGYVGGYRDTYGWFIGTDAAGTFTVLGSSASPALSPPDSHAVVFTVVGTDLVLNVDGTDVVVVSDATYAGPGSTGILSFSLVESALNIDDYTLQDPAGGGSGVHSGLTAAGFITVSAPVALQVDITGLPTGVGQGQGNPVRYFNMGSLAFGDDTTYYSRNYYVEHVAELILMPHASVHSVGYSFAPGLTATITEVVSL